jgi:hypothetical protein
LFRWKGNMQHFRKERVIFHHQPLTFVFMTRFYAWLLLYQCLPN